MLCNNAKAQPDSLLKVSLALQYPAGIVDFTTDNLGNIYLLTATNQLKKLNAKGDSMAVYNDIKRFGKIGSVDATNPLKVLVYYKDFSTIVVLDRLLQVRNTIDLKQLNLYQVTALTSSYDNNIWLYDELESKLKKIDDHGKVLLESTDFRQVFDVVPSPQVMYDRDGQLYLYDTLKGLFVFDYYGAQKNKYAWPNLMNVQVIDKNTVTATDRTHILLYKPTTFQSFSFKAFQNQERFRKIHFSGSKIYALTQTGGLEIYNTP